MTARQEAARLLALLQDQSEIERRPLEEIEEDLRLLGMRSGSGDRPRAAADGWRRLARPAS